MTALHSETLSIAARFNGPVASGNGGYSAGLAARRAGWDAGPVEATLRAPIPLDSIMRLHDEDGSIHVMTDDAATRILVMSLRRASLDAPQIRPPTRAAARAAAEHFRDAGDHVLPTCFVCGPARAPGDGLRIFTDWVAQAGNPNPFPIVAAPWTPTEDLGAPDGRVALEFVWAALDCPGAFAIEAEPILLGRMTADIIERPAPGEDCIAVAWKIGAERRKHFAGTALFNAAGRLIAHSHQTWIQIDAHAHEKAG